MNINIHTCFLHYTTDLVIIEVMKNINEQIEKLEKKININRKKLVIAIIIAIIFVVAVGLIIISNANAKKSKIDLVLSYVDLNGEVKEIHANDTITVLTNESNSVSVNNYNENDIGYIEWSTEDISSAVIDGKISRCYLSDEVPEKIKLSASGKKINDFSFSVEFVEKQLELPIKNTAWKVGNIKYYLLEDGNFYLIYENERNYIKGKYNYVKVEEETISENSANQIKEYIENGVYYKIDIAVEEEYLANSLFNSDSYNLYMCGDGQKTVILDEGWSIVKEAESIDIEEQDILEEYFVDASKKAEKKVKKQDLGNVKNTGWQSEGVNYFFYSDGVFDSISIINNDYIKGTYESYEIAPEEIDENIIEAFSELMKPKKYYKVVCNVEKEIYNCENVSVTSLEIIIAQNGIKFALYDSNWNQISDAEQIDLVARDDFDIFFNRTKYDVNKEFEGKEYDCNGVKYHFEEDGTFLAEDEEYDTSIKGTYFAIDVYDDLIPAELLKVIRNKEYSFVEIKVDKIWHQRKDTVEEDPPSCIVLLIAKTDEDIYIYDNYWGTYDDAAIIDNAEE